MYSYGPPHMAEQKQDDQLEHTYSSYVRIRDVDLKTCQRRWATGRSGERGSGISVLATRHDDDIYIFIFFAYIYIYIYIYEIFRIFSSSRIIVCKVPTLTSNCALIVSIGTRRSLSMKFFIWSINSGVLTSLLLLHLSSSFTDALPSLNFLCYSKIDARLVQDGPKAVWSIPYVSVAFFSNLKQNFIAYRSSKVSSLPDYIFENHQQWQSGFSRVYSNSCCSCSFEPDIIKISQSSHKMYSNNIVNCQESTTILYVWDLKVKMEGRDTFKVH